MPTFHYLTIEQDEISRNLLLSLTPAGRGYLGHQMILSERFARKGQRTDLIGPLEIEDELFHDTPYAHIDGYLIAPYGSSLWFCKPELKQPITVINQASRNGWNDKRDKLIGKLPDLTHEEFWHQPDYALHLLHEELWKQREGGDPVVLKYEKE